MIRSLHTVVRADRALFAVSALALANAVADSALLPVLPDAPGAVRALRRPDGRAALGCDDRDARRLRADRPVRRSDRIAPAAARERCAAAALAPGAGARHRARDAHGRPGALRAQLRDSVDGRPGRRRRLRSRRGRHRPVDRRRRRGLADRAGLLRRRDRRVGLPRLRSSRSPSEPCRSSTSSPELTPRTKRAPAATLAARALRRAQRACARRRDARHRAARSRRRRIRPARAARPRRQRSLGRRGSASSSPSPPSIFTASGALSTRIPSWRVDVRLVGRDRGRRRRHVPDPVRQLLDVRDGRLPRRVGGGASGSRLDRLRACPLARPARGARDADRRPDERHVGGGGARGTARRRSRAQRRRREVGIRGDGAPWVSSWRRGCSCRGPRTAYA